MLPKLKRRAPSSQQGQKKASKASLPLQFTIPLAGYKFSTNKIYAGTHWSKRKSVKDGIAGLATYLCRPVQKVTEFPVEISYQFSFVSRPLDTLNCAFFAKCLEDSLVSLGFIPDDDPAYVAKTIIGVNVVRQPKSKEKINESRAQDNAINEDQVVITINSLSK